MNKLMVSALTGACVLGIATSVGQGLPSAYDQIYQAGQTPEEHRAAFRAYFKNKFPQVDLAEYANGLYALPQFQTYRQEWQESMDFPPYQEGLDRGQALWDTAFPNGKTFASCFENGGRNVAHRYPYWDDQRREVRTAEMDLIDCAKNNGADYPFLSANLGQDQKARVQLAELTAHFYNLSRGQRIDIDLSHEGARKAFEKGRSIYWSRRGQLNFACYQCHVDLSGHNLGGGQPLSAGLGHTTAWPAQRIEWARIETIHQRYATCFSQVRAKPYEHLGAEYNALELYEKYMSSGLPLTAPSMRN